MTQLDEEYLKLEYGKLNGEISKLSDEIRIRERYATTFAPLAGAWIFINVFKEGGLQKSDFYLSLVICGLTFIVVLLYGLSVLLLYKNILIAGKYVKKIEDYFLKTETQSEFGWERFYADKENNKSVLVKLATTSWIIYLCLPILMAIIITIKYNS